MGGRVASIYERAKESIRNFTSDPVNNLGFLIPVAISLVALISGVVTYIIFIVNGGYAAQVGAFNEYGLFDGISEAFTTGTTELIVTGIVGKILFGLVGAEFIIILINYFKNSGKAKRVIMIVDLVFLVIQTVLTTTVFWMAIGSLVISEEAAYEFLKTFEGMTINPKAVFVTYVVITVASLVTFIVLILITKDCRWMMGYTCLGLLFANIVVPFVFLLLQNVLPIAGIIVVILIGIIAFKIIEFIFACMVETDTDEDIARRLHEDIDRLLKK